MNANLITEETPQEKMQKKLEKLPIPKKEIHCYGSQIVITTVSLKSAEKWAETLSHFAKVRTLLKTYDYAKKNKGVCLNPKMIVVYRVFAKIM